MSFCKIKYSKSSEKFIKENKKIGIRFFQAFEKISDDKKNIQFYDIKKFFSAKYSDVLWLRIGNFRAFFRIIDSDFLIYVFDIGSRGDVYKKINI